MSALSLAVVICISGLRGVDEIFPTGSSLRRSHSFRSPLRYPALGAHPQLVDALGNGTSHRTTCWALGEAFGSSSESSLPLSFLGLCFCSLYCKVQTEYNCGRHLQHVGWRRTSTEFFDFAEFFAGDAAWSRALRSFGFKGRSVDVPVLDFNHRLYVRDRCSSFVASVNMPTGEVRYDSVLYNFLHPLGYLASLNVLRWVKEYGVVLFAPPCSSWVQLCNGL